MNIAKFIKKNNSPYDDSLDKTIESVEKLVEQETISAQFGSVLISFFIRKEVSKTIRHNLMHVMHNYDKRDRWFLINYTKKRTNYI